MQVLPISILYVCHDGKLYGSQQSLLLVLRRLSREAFKPFVSLARQGPLADTLRLMPGVTLLRHQRVQWFKHDRRNVLQQFGDLVGLLLLALPRAYGLFLKIRQNRIQLVHTNSVVSFEGAIAAWLAGVPHVWHIRELFMEDSPKLFPVLSRSLTRWLIVHLSNKVVCISHAVEQQFGPYLKQYPTRFSVVYNAVDRDDEHAAMTSREPLPLPAFKRLKEQFGGNQPFTLGYVGRMSEGKRFHDLVHALHMAQEQSGELIQLIVAGDFADPAYETMIQTLVSDLKLSECVHFLGYQSSLGPVFHRMDALVVPSLNEPFGRVVIEAMKAGVPCVAARSGGIPEIVTHDHTGFLFTPKDLSGLARLILEVMRNPTHRAKVVDQARKMVRERFTVDEQIQALESAYQRVLRP